MKLKLVGAILLALSAVCQPAYADAVLTVQLGFRPVGIFYTGPSSASFSVSIGVSGPFGTSSPGVSWGWDRICLRSTSCAPSHNADHVRKTRLDHVAQVSVPLAESDCHLSLRFKAESPLLTVLS